MKSQVEEGGTAQIPPIFMSDLFVPFLEIKNPKVSVFGDGGRTEKEKTNTYENDTTVRKGQTLQRMH